MSNTITERPNFFALERASQTNVLSVLEGSDHPLSLDEIFGLIRPMNRFFTSDVIQHSVMSLLVDQKANLTPDLKVVPSK